MRLQMKYPLKKIWITIGYADTTDDTAVNREAEIVQGDDHHPGLDIDLAVEADINRNHLVRPLNQPTV